MKKYIFLKLFLLTLVAGSCQELTSKSKKVYESTVFKQYWYAGQAEMNSYTLSQSRYGEQRQGKAVLTMTSQEWCGQVFSQMNLSGTEYNVKSYSYFEKEGDANFSVKKLLLEDEMWNIIRLEPTALPTGKIEIIPGMFFTRLSHLEIKPQAATAVKSESASSFTYSLAIPQQHRTLSVEFEKKFPHKIIAWTEEFEERGVLQRTTASLDKTLVTDYWTKNKNQFQYLRDSLNLSAPH